MNDRTMTFSLTQEKDNEMRQVLTTVYDALREKGYNISDENIYNGLKNVSWAGRFEILGENW